MAMPPPEPRPEWLPSGFPPRSFPPGPPASPPTSGPPTSPPPVGRGRLLAAVAAFVALILLAAGLFAATRGNGDDEAQLSTGTSLTVPDTSIPTFDLPSTTAATTPPSIEPVVTSAASTSTRAAPASAAAGLLEVSPATLVLPKADATAGATRGTLTLRNVGGSPLTFAVQPTVVGLTAAPTKGNLGPGASLAMTVNLDASRVPGEGPFSGMLNFSGSGGSREVQVQSMTGRPPDFADDVGEPCPVPSPTCSRQIKLAPPSPSEPSPSPCNTPWAYAVTITDQSQITNARAIARRGVANADALLQQAAGTNIFVSNSFSPLPKGTGLRFALAATDVHGFERRLPEQTITC